MTALPTLAYLNCHALRGESLISLEARRPNPAIDPRAAITHRRVVACGSGWPAGLPLERHPPQPRRGVAAMSDIRINARPAAEHDTRSLIGWGAKPRTLAAIAGRWCSAWVPSPGWGMRAAPEASASSELRSALSTSSS